MKTIIQSFPTIYGETLNGSVYGQPNGSIARPPQNVATAIVIAGDSGTLTLEVTIASNAIYVLNGVTAAFVNPGSIYETKAIVTNGDGDVVARGKFWDNDTVIRINGPASETPTDGDALSVVFTAYDEYGDVIATSNTLSIVAVIPE